MCVCVFAENKRKIEDQAYESNEVSNAKTKKVDEKKCSDLIVLGLAWKTTDKELREYFEQFGELLMAQVKKDPKTGQSKGFGFVRYDDYESQLKVVAKRHCISGRWCDVRLPMSKDGDRVHDNSVNKIFIGRLTQDVKPEDLREYFSKYGHIEDVFIPKPFRGFAFVTFDEKVSCQSFLSEDHLIKGSSVYVSTAVPKQEMSAQYNSPAPSDRQRYSRDRYDSYSPSNNRYSNSNAPGYYSYNHPPPPPYSAPTNHYAGYTSPTSGPLPSNYSDPSPGYDYYSRPTPPSSTYSDSPSQYNRYNNGYGSNYQY